jgi:hypothetical protein
LTRLAAVDWTNKVALVAEVQPYLEPLLTMLRESEKGSPNRGPITGVAEDLLIIAISELMTLVCFADEQAEAWEGKLILYVGDNRKVQQWIESRNAGNPLASWLLRILVALECLKRFTVLAAYFRT